MELVPVSQLVPGVIVELSGKQKLWDITKSPWQELLPPTRLRVLKVSRMATGATDGRFPYDLVLEAADGTHIRLEVLDGHELIAIVESA